MESTENMLKMNNNMNMNTDIIMDLNTLPKSESDKDKIIYYENITPPVVVCEKEKSLSNNRDKDKMKEVENDFNLVAENGRTPLRTSVNFWKLQQLEKYSLMDIVGKGTFGVVYKAELYNKSDLSNNSNITTNIGIGMSINKDLSLYHTNSTNNKKTFALKEILTQKETEGFPITALREIMLLKRLKHENIIELNEIVVSKEKKKIFLVFDYMQHDLAGLIDKNTVFSMPVIKYIFHCLLKGVEYLHNNNVMHRDIKSSNILINNDGSVKLADFGLGKMRDTRQIMTYRVVTLWYRCPELLLGCKEYDGSIDMWSLG